MPGRELRVVAIGGGTGLSTLLKGLKKYVVSAGDPQLSSGSDFARISELCAVVTVTDDGGSSGRLRKEFNMLPPGDVRNCIVALSEDEALLSKVFQHRFEIYAIGSGKCHLSGSFVKYWRQVADGLVGGSLSKEIRDDPYLYVRCSCNTAS